MIKEFRPELLPKIRELVLKANRRVLSQTMTGAWVSSVKGHGIEFSDYRLYGPGDDAKLIDWKASLRSRKLLVKELTEEKNLVVILLVDVSNSMLYGSHEMLKAEYAASVASSVAFAALRAGDAVGMVLFNDRIATFVKPSMGMRQHAVIVDVLTRPQHYGGGFDLDKTMSQLMGAITQRGLVVIVSDFIGLSERWKRYLEIASGKFELIGVVVRDPRDRRLPQHAGEYVLEDPYADDRIIIDCATYWKPYETHVAKEEEHIRNTFRLLHSDIVVLETDKDFAQPLMRFFHKRSLQVEH